jgi:hypothetical protein
VESATAKRKAEHPIPDELLAEDPKPELGWSSVLGVFVL